MAALNQFDKLKLSQKNLDTLLRSYSKVGFILIFGLIIQTWTNQVDLTPGDPATRSLNTLYTNLSPSSLFEKKHLISIWPAGHELIFSIPSRLNKPTTIQEFLVGYKSFSAILFGVGFLSIAIISTRTHGRLTTILFTAWTFTSSLLLSNYASGLSEIAVFSLLGLAFYLTTTAINKGKTWPLIIAATLLAFSTSIRNEAIVYSFCFYLYVLFNKGFIASFAFGLITSSYFIIRMFAVFFLSNGADTFLNYNARNYGLTEVQGMIHGFFEKWWSTDPIPSILMLVFIALSITAFLTKRRYFNKKNILSKKQSILESPLVLAFFLSALGIIFLTSQILAGNINDQIRYIIPFYPFLGYLLAGLANKSLLNLRIIFHSRTSVSSILIATTVLAICIGEYLSIIQNQQRRSHESVEISNFLEKTQFGNRTFYDFARQEEIPLLLNSLDPTRNPEYWFYAGTKFRINQLPPSIDLSDRTNRKYAITYGAHSFINTAKPRYLVLPADSWFNDEIRNMNFRSHYHLRPSYIRSSITHENTQNDVDLQFHSKYFPESKPIRLKQVIANSRFVIYENLDGNLLKSPNDLHNPLWRTEFETKITTISVASPVFGLPVQEIQFGDQARLFQTDNESINAGETRAASALLWSTNPVTIRLEIGRHDRTPYEGSSVEIALTKTPTRYYVSHTFEHDHLGGSRFMIRESTSQSEATFHLAEAMVTRIQK